MEIKESNYGIEAYYRRGGKKRYYEDRFAGGIGAEDFLLPKDVNGGGGQRLSVEVARWIVIIM